MMIKGVAKSVEGVFVGTAWRSGRRRLRSGSGFLSNIVTETVSCSFVSFSTKSRNSEVNDPPNFLCFFLNFLFLGFYHTYTYKDVQDHSFVLFCEKHIE